MNYVVLTGRLTFAPEVRYTTKGTAVASFTLAVNSGYGEHKRTDFIPVVVWSKLAEVCGNNLDKGSKILVEGSLQIRSYDGNDGQKKRVAEIVAQNIEFLDPKKKEEGPRDYNVNSFGADVFPEEEIPY